MSKGRDDIFRERVCVCVCNSRQPLNKKNGKLVCKMGSNRGQKGWKTPFNRAKRTQRPRRRPDADFFQCTQVPSAGGWVGGVGVNRLEFDWTWRQLQSGNGSSRLWTETLAVPASLRRTNICLVLFSINTLLTGDTLVRFQEPRLMAAAEPGFHTRLAIFTPGWDICASCQQPSS